MIHLRTYLLLFIALLAIAHPTVTDDDFEVPTPALVERGRPSGAPSGFRGPPGGGGGGGPPPWVKAKFGGKPPGGSGGPPQQSQQPPQDQSQGSSGGDSSQQQSQQPQGPPAGGYPAGAKAKAYKGGAGGHGGSGGQSGSSGDNSNNQPPPSGSAQQPQQPQPTAQQPASGGGGGGSGYMATVNTWRSKMSLSPFTQDSKLEANALDTSQSSGGQLKHKLNSGSMGQVMAPGNSGNFESVFVGGWLCEMPQLPGLGSSVCNTMSKGWNHAGQTGHAELLSSKTYKKIGCALASGIWTCDLA
ncbi:uncharacterized protein AB675_3299 [Cyphellophora attinorum]|uniref:SCP domain-containing protein n=1 Tax=Cyphellophora attinorum TaxID=1664694 RepID=A0A0N0NLX9_9EURO|nr:uncharacterized protein AB675_3299 [Phialophora attinorum]KPI39559.1 hypothetical protein AB675_3299 [Phialophora attinorum]